MPECSCARGFPGILMPSMLDYLWDDLRKTMTCETVKPLLSEFADDTLDASTAWQVQTHLAECVACGTDQPGDPAPCGGR